MDRPSPASCQACTRNKERTYLCHALLFQTQPTNFKSNDSLMLFNCVLLCCCCTVQTTWAATETFSALVITDDTTLWQSTPLVVVSSGEEEPTHCKWWNLTGYRAQNARMILNSLWFPSDQILCCRHTSCETVTCWIKALVFYTWQEGCVFPHIMARQPQVCHCTIWGASFPNLITYRVPPLSKLIGRLVAIF